MGRETKILLGLLGLLAGVFVGVVSIKLFVPRPPVGAGPDVDTALAEAEPHDLVEPPGLSMRASDFAAAPPLTPLFATAADAALPPASAAPDPEDRSASRTGGFPTSDPSSRPAAPPTFPPRRDPSITTASFDQDQVDDDLGSSPSGIEPAANAGNDDGEPTATGVAAATADRFVATPPEVSAARSIAVSPGPDGVAMAAGHVARPGDTWWSLAERAYGDGRLYRAVYAWNRARDPRVTLAPGTPLEFPPLVDLTAAWPQLVPPR